MHLCAQTEDKILNCRSICEWRNFSFFFLFIGESATLAVTHRPTSQQVSVQLQCRRIRTCQFSQGNTLPTFCVQRSWQSFPCGPLRSMDSQRLHLSAVQVSESHQGVVMRRRNLHRLIYGHSSAILDLSSSICHFCCLTWLVPWDSLGLWSEGGLSPLDALDWMLQLFTEKAKWENCTTHKHRAEKCSGVAAA